MHELARCIVCDNSSFEEVYASTFSGSWEDAVPHFLSNRQAVCHGRIVRCPVCGFTATSPQFSEEEYAQIYQGVRQAAGASEDRAASIGCKDLRQEVLKYVSAGCFLDLGCGDGSFLREMPDFDGVGFEVSPCPVRREGNVYFGNFRDFAAETVKRGEIRPSFITAWSVIEHLPRLDDYMSAVRDSLPAGGYLFCLLPNARSAVARLSGEKWNCFLLEHLWYFAPATFRRYADRFGFDAVDISPRRYAASLDLIVERARQTYGLPAFPLPRWLGRIVLRLPIGVMFVALRKRD